MDFYKNNKERIDRYLLIAVVCVLYNIFFSYTFNLISGNLMGTEIWGVHDSQLFYYFGNKTFNGAVPYIDFWDHKGVFLFDLFSVPFFFKFIPPEISAAIFMTMFVFINSVLSYELIRKLTNKASGVLETIIMTILINYLIVHNYSCEMLIMPFVLFLAHISLKYYKNHIDGKDSSFLALLCGILLGIIFNIRVKEIAYGAVPFAVVTYYELKDKNYKQYFKYVGLVLLGFAGTMLYVMLPYILNGTFYDWLYGNVLFSLEYAEANNLIIAKLIRIFEGYELFVWLLVLNSVIISIYTMFKGFKAKNFTAEEIIFIVYSLIGLFLGSIGVPAMHYLVFLVPFIIISIRVTIDFAKKYFNALKNKTNMPIGKKITALSLSLLLFASVGQALFATVPLEIWRIYSPYHELNNYVKDRGYEPDSLYDATSFMISDRLNRVFEIIKEQDPNFKYEDAFIVDANGNIYLEDNVQAKKYISYHSWHSQYSEEIHNTIKDYTNEHKYVIWGKLASENDFLLEEFINENKDNVEIVYDYKEFTITKNLNFE